MADFFKGIYAKVKRNPALVYGFINALFGVLAIVGLPVSAPTAAAIVALVNAIMALVVRSKVTPVNDPRV